MSLQHILDPIAPQSFLTHYWQQQYVSVHRSNSTYYASYFTDNVPEFFSGIVANESILDKKYVHSDGPINYMLSDHRVNDSFTIIINNIQKHCVDVQRVTDIFQKMFFIRTQVNLYITPPSCCGFPVHFDRMDVFVLQLSGSKQWDIYAPLIPQPRPEMHFGLRNVSMLRLLGKERLHPGDFLYIPAGFFHQAHGTIGTTDSYHLTFGVETTSFGSWETVLIDIISATMKGDDDVDTSTLICDKNQKSFRDTVLHPINDDIVWGHIVIFVIMSVGTTIHDVRLAVPIVSDHFTSQLHRVLDSIQNNVDMDRAYRLRNHTMILFDPSLQHVMMKAHDTILDERFIKRIRKTLKVIRCCIMNDPETFLQIMKMRMESRLTKLLF